MHIPQVPDFFNDNMPKPPPKKVSSIETLFEGNELTVASVVPEDAHVANEFKTVAYGGKETEVNDQTKSTTSLSEESSPTTPYSPSSGKETLLSSVSSSQGESTFLMTKRVDLEADEEANEIYSPHSSTQVEAPVVQEDSSGGVSIKKEQ